MRHALTRLGALSSGRLGCIHLQALPAASAWTPRPSKLDQLSDELKEGFKRLDEGLNKIDSRLEKIDSRLTAIEEALNPSIWTVLRVLYNAALFVAAACGAIGMLMAMRGVGVPM